MGSKNFAGATSVPKKPFKGPIYAEVVKGLSFFAKSVFKVFLSSKCVPKTYYNTIYVEILIYEQNNFARVTSEPIKPLKGSI